MSDTNLKLDQSLDEILFQLSKGNTFERMKRGVYWSGFEQVKEWKNRFGYQFHIYSNDHLIDNKPHFHLRKKSDDIDCRFFFSGTLFDCKGKGKVDKKIISALNYLLSNPIQQKRLIEFWNLKNPDLIIKE
jgi:hypothetical protein